VAAHHDEPAPDGRPLARVLYSARLCGDWMLTGRPATPDALGSIEALSGGRLAAEDIPTWIDRIGERADALRDGLSRL
jgi:hypothetical protein